MKTQRKIRNLDSFTFGNSRAAINLASILSKEENRAFQRKVSAKIHKFQGILKSCSAIIPAENKRFVLSIVLKSIKERIRFMMLPNNVSSHMMNILTVSYRLALEPIK